MAGQHSIKTKELLIDRVDPADSTAREAVDVSNVANLLVYKATIDATAGDTTAVITLPDYAYVQSAHLKVGTAWVGGTSVIIGNSDADGLFATILTAALTANSTHIGGGAVVGTNIDALAASKEIDVDITGTFTAGDAVLTVVCVDVR